MRTHGVNHDRVDDSGVDDGRVADGRREATV